MRIGLNLLYLIPHRVGGTQTYAERLIAALADIGTQHEYFLYVNSAGASLRWPARGNFRTVVCRFPAKSQAARYAYEQLALPRRLQQDRIDLLHSLGYVSPLRSPCPSVVSIHDAVFVGYPMSAARRALLRFFVTHSARRCDHVITVSEFSKHQIAHHVGVSEAKISVIYEGPRDLPSRGTVTWDQLQRRYHLTQPYVMAFGASRPHKNILRLVAAFADFARTSRHSLVIVGKLPAGGEVESEVQRRHLGARVVLTGYVPDEHVMPLLSAADIFAFPSWYEGFGLPVLDAQRAGVPVACSRAASLPEVAGEGAEYFDPFSVEQMAVALRRCAESGEHRRHLVASAIANVERFSWGEAARRTLDVYERAVAGNAMLDLATGRSAGMIPHPTT